MSSVADDVLAFHRECVVLDLHIDTLLWVRMLGYDLARRHRNRLPGSPFAWHLDLPRAAEGGLDVVVFGLVINPDRVRPELIAPLKLLARIERGRGAAQTLETLDLLRQAGERHPDRLVFARSGTEVRKAVADGKLAGLACLEGSQGIGASLDALERAYERGLRMLGLVHFQATEVGHPMTAREFDGQGLTEFGHDLVAELERLGVIVDLAHLNAAGVDDALATMKRPFVVSHTACRALHDVSRNLTDEQIRRVAARGGVIGLAFGRDFLGRGGLSRLLDHVDHLVRVGGVETAALGSDLDGAIVPGRGLGDVTVYPRITAGLLARGHSRDAVRKILGKNALRVLTDVLG